MSSRLTLASKIKLLSGQHIEAINCNALRKGIPYLTGPSDFSGTIPVASKYTEHPKVRCQKGDILLTVKGSGTGSIAIADKEYCISRQLMAIRCKDIIPTFIQYLLEYNEKNFNSAASGLIPGISRIDVLKLKIPSFKLSEQTAIADLLSTWDHAIVSIERLIATKEQRFLWLSDHYLFGGNKPNAKALKRTKWYSVPDHWKIVKIGSLAKEVTDTNEAGENIPVLSCTKYDGLVDSLTYFDKQVFSMDTSNYKVVSRGQFAYATNHIEEGSIGYQNLYSKGLVSPMYTVFKAETSIDDSYLYKILKTKIYKHIFQVSTSASVDRRGSLRWKEFATLPIPLPPIDEQQKISRDLDMGRKEIDLLKKQANAYRRQKRSLMQKLLTGQWRVKTKEERA